MSTALPDSPRDEADTASTDSLLSTAQPLGGKSEYGMAVHELLDSVAMDYPDRLCAEAARFRHSYADVRDASRSIA